MKRLIAILFFCACTVIVKAQQYLIKNTKWHQKIQKNHSLAPLFYGVKKTSAEIANEKTLTKNLITQYGSTSLAYKQMLINGWNYFTVGRIDSAIINFNNAYLLDNNNIETFYAIGSVIAFIDGKPNFDLITQFKLDKKVSSGWDVMIFFGDEVFLSQLKTNLKHQPLIPKLNKILSHPRPPYVIDSAKYVTIKVKIDNNEGFYKMGKRSGLWTDYYFGTSKIMRTYTIINGIETGQITAYHKNGKISDIFYKDKKGDLNGERKVFDYNGQLVRIEYWKDNSSHKADSKIFKEWEADGETTSEIVDGKEKVFVWKDGKKTLKQTVSL